MTSDTLPKVTFTITKFRKVGGSHHYCEYTMALSNGGDTVSIEGTNTLVVTSKQTVQIEFTAAGDYLLSGICFRETDPGMGDPNGAEAFPCVMLSLGNGESTLTLTDTAQNNSSYEFAMLVVGVKEKALGLIDPPIINRPPA